jgi:hypothetical protein
VIEREHRLLVRNVGKALTVTVEPQDTGLRPEGSPPLVCTESCDWRLPAGRYRIVVTAGKREKSQDFELSKPLLLRAEEPSKAGRIVGLTVGLVGVAAAAWGAFATLAILASGGQMTDEASAKWLPVGLVPLGVGAVLMPIGFSLHAANRAPAVDIQELANEDRMRPRPSGAGLSLQGRF